MANVSELPELISESLDLTKQYFKQETVEPAKRLGKAAGFGFGGAALFGLAALFGGIAVNRWIIRLLPDGRAWSGLAYVISALVLVLIGAIILAVGRRGYEDPGSVKDALPALRDELTE
ncbi:MAG: phage holin family protein [Acidimicrobiia bacterium]|nr:phage holin family protein [Acidimicrobiia bacterium]